MYMVDFLPVENEDGDSTKSGDAIAMQFTVPGSTGTAVVVIDAGLTAIGDKVADHVDEYFDTRHVDLVISTHPDTDHLNGILTLIERCSVGELLMHLPWNHHAQAHELGNYERIRALYDRAIALGIKVTEPFTGLTCFNGAITILGPNEVFYSAMLAESVSTDMAGGSQGFAASSGVLTKLTKVLERTLAAFPIETLSNSDETSARNKTSVITLLDVEGYKFLFTGDAGIPSLDRAADYYEAVKGQFSTNPVYVFQTPHHGSHRNVGPDILDRILGSKGSGFGTSFAISSSSKLSEKHPSPKVTNALGRRIPGPGRVYATEGKTIGFERGVARGWPPASAIGPLEEDAD